MDFTLDEQQQSIIDAVRVLLGRMSGPTRAKIVSAYGYDAELFDALSQSGFLDMATDPDGGALSASLLVEEVAAAVGWVNVGARALVAPALLGDSSSVGEVALAVGGTDQPVRFGAAAEILLVLDGDRARRVENNTRTARAADSPFGFPYACVDLDGGENLGPGSGPRLRRWWQATLAAEMVGAATAALELTNSYLKERKQFGRPIGALQAVQHRLAEATVLVEGSRWLSRSAAWGGAQPEITAAAVSYAGRMARLVGTDLHQLTGAIGFTYEYDLHLWTTRLHALRFELGGVGVHERELAEVRWVQRTPTPVG